MIRVSENDSCKSFHCGFSLLNFSLSFLPLLVYSLPLHFLFTLPVTIWLNISFLRSDVLGASWTYGNSEVAELSLEMFRAWMENRSQV